MVHYATILHAHGYCCMCTSVDTVNYQNSTYYYFDHYYATMLLALQLLVLMATLLVLVINCIARHKKQCSSQPQPPYETLHNKSDRTLLKSSFKSEAEIVTRLTATAY
jgi:hypothetical protein